MDKKAERWFLSHGIAAGQWYTEALSFAKRAMHDADLGPYAFQVLICLRTHTVAHQSELARTMFKGKVVNLRSHHVMKETGLTRQQVRVGLVELETKGYVKRVSVGEKG